LRVFRESFLTEREAKAWAAENERRRKRKVKADEFEAQWSKFLEDTRER
jgi:hypothetical protein